MKTIAGVSKTAALSILWSKHTEQHQPNTTNTPKTRLNKNPCCDFCKNSMRRCMRIFILHNYEKNTIWIMLTFIFFCRIMYLNAHFSILLKFRPEAWAYWVHWDKIDWEWNKLRKEKSWDPSVTGGSPKPCLHAFSKNCKDGHGSKERLAWSSRDHLIEYLWLQVEENYKWTNTNVRMY